MKKLVKICCLIAWSLFFLPLGCAVSIPDQDMVLYRDPGRPLFQVSAVCGTAVAGQDALENPGIHALDGHRISVLNWNIYKNSSPEWQRDFLALSQQRDIILLQEALLSEEMTTLLKEQQLYWRLNRAFSYNNQAAGVLIGSAQQPVSTCGLRHAEPFLRVPKTILLNRYRIKGSAQDLLVANIHGINFTLGSAPYLEQMEALRTVLRQHDGPLLVAGDFNNWNKEKTRVMTEMARALLLQELVFTHPEQTRILGKPVDHIFYRGLEVLSHATHPVDSSDHNAMSVVFRLDRATVSKREPWGS